MKQDPSRGGGSTLSPAYSAALERLAKKRLIGDAPADEPARIGNAPAGGRPIIGGTGKGGLGIVGDALNMAKGIVLSPVATAADIAWKPFEAIPGAPDFNPEDAGTVNLFVQGGKSLKHVTGDAYQLGRSIITGKDTLSESPTAKAWKAAGGGLPGVLAVAGPYLDVGSVVAPMAMGAARGAGLVAPVPVPYEPLTVADLNAAQETFGAPTNAYRTTRKALAEDMAQAQVPRPTVAPATISPRLEVPTIAPTVPDMPPGFPLPEVPSNMTLQDFQRMPEYQAYIEAGRSIDPRAMSGFAFDPETAYLVHSGRSQLIGGKLDPHRTLSSLNENQLMGVMRGHDSAVLASESLQDALDTFVRTGIWNGDELAQRMPPGYSSEGGKFPLKGIVKASDMTDEQLQAFVNTIQERINRHTDFVSQARPYLSLARREPFLSYYPAPVGAREGYMRWHSGPEGGAMYLAGVPADRATTLFGPGIYEKRLGVPEWQAFGEQTPIAGITEFPSQWGYGQFPDEMEAITRAFAVQKTIEDRMRRGFYGRAEGRRLIPEVTAPQAGRTMNPVEELASAKARAETAPVVRDTAAEGTDWRDPKVFDVGGERVVFGPPELDISSVKAGPDGVRVVPIDPYELSNLKMGTEAGDKIADDFTIAMGVDKEMASALLYAGSRGNKSAMAQFEQLVKTGRAQLKQIRAEINSKPEIPDEVWATTTPDAMVNTGKTVRPANIDDLFLVHETAYAPSTNQAGDVMLSPASAFRSDVARDTVHFALNKVVEANTRVFSGDNRYIVVVPLRDVLDANPGSLDNLLWGDTFFTPKPGEGLRLPSRSVKVLTNPDANEVAETLAQVAAAHNKSPDYQLLRANEVGGHTTEGLTKRITYLADRIIPEEYPEYLAEITSSLHQGTPAQLKEYGFGFVDSVGKPFIERMSPNQRKRFFRGEKRFLARDVSDNKSIEDIWS